MLVIHLKRERGRLKLIDTEWEENKHHRAGNGQFGSGGSSKPEPKSLAATPADPLSNRLTGSGKGNSGSGEASRASASGNASPTPSVASELYAKHATNVPRDPAEQVRRGAEIASKVGVAHDVAVARVRMHDAVSTDRLVSEGGHRLETGEYTPERAALHNKILSEVFTPEAVARALPDDGARPTMTVLGGRGGSGKSWLTSGDGPVDASKAIVIDADHFKTELPEYQGWNAGQLHEESSHLVDEAANMAKELGVNVVFDATLKSSKAADRRITQFGDSHDLHGFYMFASPETATERAMERFKRGGTKGRFVPPEVVMANTDNEKNFDAAVPNFKRWGVYDNNASDGSAPKRIGGSADG